MNRIQVEKQESNLLSAEGMISCNKDTPNMQERSGRVNLAMRQNQFEQYTTT